MSKPKKIRVMCPDCRRQKMLFESERKANDFIKWNGDDIDSHGRELRSYYCPSCCGWHITSKEHTSYYDHTTDDLISAYERQKWATNSLKASKASDASDKVRKAVDAILSEMPSDGMTRAEAKEWLNEYFKEHEELSKIENLIRHDVYNHSQISDMSAEEVYKTLSEDDKKDTVSLFRACKRNFVTSDVREKVYSMWCIENYANSHAATAQ
jgi:hypothetical protein